MWRKKITKVVAVVVTIAVIVLVVIIRNRKDEFERIEAAHPGWLSETGCAEIDVVKPSRNTGFDKWIGPGATTAEIICEYVSGGLEYARFKSIPALDAAVHLRPHRARLCVFGRTLLDEEFGDEGEDLRNFNKMCRNLRGIRY
ncbi:MAG: hypothetical protein ACRDLF_03770 [Solirubrobacteraceae bacterium]